MNMMLKNRSPLVIWGHFHPFRRGNEKWGRFKKRRTWCAVEINSKSAEKQVEETVSTEGWIKLYISLQKEKKKLYKIYKKDSPEKNKVEYCIIRPKVKKELRLAKREFERQISENAKCNPKRFFQNCSGKTKARGG